MALYNREEYLKKAVKTVLNSRYHNWELLILDDGSTDSSLSIAKSFNDSRIKVFSYEHKGCWVVKNEGIKNASGDLLFFLDSDDFISMDYLDIAVRAIEANPVFDYYYPTALDIVDENGNPTNTIWRYLDYPPKDKWRLLNLFLTHGIGGIPHGGAFIRKQVFEHLGYYDSSLFNMADTIYIIKNVLKINFCLIPELRCYYNRQHPQQLNKSFAQRNRIIADGMKYIIDNYDHELYFPEIKDIPAAERSKKLNEFYFNCFMFMSDQSTAHKEPYQEYASHYLRELRKNL